MGCMMDDGDTRMPEKMGKQLWDITLNDIRRVNSILNFAAHFEHMLSIEDEALREEYKARHFHDASITESGGKYRLTYTTQYNTTYSITVEQQGDTWHYLRSGGSSYDLSIRYTGECGMEATFSNIRNNESSGYATLIGSIALEEENLLLTYTGEMVMVDSSKGDNVPLTMTTTIDKALEYSTFNGINGGHMTITAHDALYNSTDEADVTIQEYKNTVIIDCYGVRLAYRYNNNIE